MRDRLPTLSLNVGLRHRRGNPGRQADLSGDARGFSADHGRRCAIDAINRFLDAQFVIEWRRQGHDLFAAVELVEGLDGEIVPAGKGTDGRDALAGITADQKTIARPRQSDIEQS